MDTSINKRRLAVLSQHIQQKEEENGNQFLERENTSGHSASPRVEGLLKGQVAIITGSGQGIGEAAAYLFASEGSKVVVTDLDGEKAKKVADEIKRNGGEAIAVAGDVTNVNFPKEVIQKTIDAFGKINILVNNAGYTWDGVIHKMTDKQWDAMLAVHNTAPFRLIREIAPYMRDAAKAELDNNKIPENRAIVNVSSTSGLHGNAGQINYSTAKMGIVGLTKTVAKEWGPFQIRCNSVAFGFIETRLTRSKEEGQFIEVEGKKVALGIPGSPSKENLVHVPLRRPGKTEEAAYGILFLAAPQASYITGHTLEVTGGAGI